MVKTKIITSRETSSVSDLDTKINKFLEDEGIDSDKLIDIKFQFVQKYDPFWSVLIIYQK